MFGLRPSARRSSWGSLGPLPTSLVAFTPSNSSSLPQYLSLYRSLTLTLSSQEKRREMLVAHQEQLTIDQHTTLSLSIYRSFTTSLSLSLSLSRSILLSLSHTHTHAHTHTLSLTHTLSRSFFLSISLSLSHSLFPQKKRREMLVAHQEQLKIDQQTVQRQLDSKTGLITRQLFQPLLDANPPPVLPQLEIF